MNARAPRERWPALAALAALARRGRSTSSVPRLDGGLALARDKPGLERAIVDVPLPRTLVLPLVGHRGRTLVPTVTLGQRVARGDALAPGLPASADGRVVAIEPRPVAHPAGRDAPCVVIETERGARSAAMPPEGSCPDDIDPTLPPLPALTLERLIACGVGGLGGAGFPTRDKLAGAADGGVHTLVVNGAECEPGIACDEASMPVRADEIVAGSLALARLAGAARVLLVVESDKRAARAALETAIDETPMSDALELRLLDVAPVYPSGAERLVLRLATGIDVPAGSRPGRHGLLSVNVATAIAAHRARLGEPSLTRVVTVAGARVTRPCNARVVFGTPIGDVFDALDLGPRADDTRCRIGGPLSGFDVASERVPVTAMTNRIALEAPRVPSSPRPCIRCAACSDVCPVDLLPQELLRHARSGDGPALDRGGLDACLECGCCDLVCPSSIELTATFRHARGARLDERLRERDAASAEERFRRRESRLAARPVAGVSPDSRRRDARPGGGVGGAASLHGDADEQVAPAAHEGTPGIGSASASDTPKAPGSTTPDPEADPVAAALSRARRRRRGKGIDDRRDAP